MAFTNPWDETFPPDSQPANLLGNDLRRLRQDVRERMMAFASGPFADRPAPEAVFGNGNDGVMYFSTDTRQVFRWNGAAWVDITASFQALTFKATNVVSLVNPASSAAGINVTIPGGTLQIGDLIEITMLGYHVAGPDTLNGFVLNFGGNIITPPVQNNAYPGGQVLRAFGIVQTANQIALYLYGSEYNQAISAVRAGYGGFNLANPILVQHQFDLSGDANGTWNSEAVIVKIFR